jgi:hypothetical protein
LSRENKVKLIAKLTREIAEKTDKKKEEIIDRFSGAFESNKPTDGIMIY